MQRKLETPLLKDKGVVLEILSAISFNTDKLDIRLTDRYIDEIFDSYTCKTIDKQEATHILLKFVRKLNKNKDTHRLSISNKLGNHISLAYKNKDLIMTLV